MDSLAGPFHIRRYAMQYKKKRKNIYYNIWRAQNRES